MTPDKQAQIDRNHAEIDNLSREISVLEDQIKAYQKAYSEASVIRTQKISRIYELSRANIRLLKDYVMPKGDPDAD
jgi:uncharacterized coiled-coil DUF342 family protein